jgi:hypothetical protein
MGERVSRPHLEGDELWRAVVGADRVTPNALRCTAVFLVALSDGITCALCEQLWPEPAFNHPHDPWRNHFWGKWCSCATFRAPDPVVFMTGLDARHQARALGWWCAQPSGQAMVGRGGVAPAALAPCLNALLWMDSSAGRSLRRLWAGCATEAECAAAERTWAQERPTGKLRVLERASDEQLAALIRAYSDDLGTGDATSRGAAAT